MLIYKSGLDNVVSDALSKKEEYLDLNMMAIALNQDDMPFKLNVKKTYKIDGNIIKLNKMFNLKLILKKRLFI